MTVTQIWFRQKCGKRLWKGTEKGFELLSKLKKNVFSPVWVTVIPLCSNANSGKVFEIWVSWERDPLTIKLLSPTSYIIMHKLADRKRAWFLLTYRPACVTVPDAAPSFSSWGEGIIWRLEWTAYRIAVLTTILYVHCRGRPWSGMIPWYCLVVGYTYRPAVLYCSYTIAMTLLFSRTWQFARHVRPLAVAETLSLRVSFDIFRCFVFLRRPNLASSSCSVCVSRHFELFFHCKYIDDIGDIWYIDDIGDIWYIDDIWYIACRWWHHHHLEFLFLQFASLNKYMWGGCVIDPHFISFLFEWFSTIYFLYKPYAKDIPITKKEKRKKTMV